MQTWTIHPPVPQDSTGGIQGKRILRYFRNKNRFKPPYCEKQRHNKRC